MEHPVSKVLIELMKEHREALVENLLLKSWEQDNLGLMNQIKGQINTYDYVLNFESFFEDRIQEENTNG